LSFVRLRPPANRFDQHFFYWRQWYHRIAISVNEIAIAKNVVVLDARDLGEFS
jgi:hypothetical protein